jgi:hypothetical protein
VAWRKPTRIHFGSRGDPLFAALFRNADKIQILIENTDKGVRVTETSSDADVTKLIRRHAEVVGLFIKNGMHEMMQVHAAP